MSAMEPYDFLSVMPIDYDYTLSITAQETVSEAGFKNQVIHMADDNSEERITLASGSIFYADVPWPILSESDSGVIMDLYHDAAKANGMGRVFKWLSHDGHTYAVRFDGKMDRSTGPALRHGIPTVRFRLLGKNVFIDVASELTKYWSEITSLGTDLYACVYGGSIWKSVDYGANWTDVASGLNKNWYGITSLGTDLYACVYGGSTWKSSNYGVNWTDLVTGNKNWYGITSLGTDLYACVYGGSIWKC